MGNILIKRLFLFSVVVILALFFSSVIRVDASDSTIPLSKGWNFISFPRQPQNTAIGTVFVSLSSNVRIVWGYDNQSKVWKKYVPGGLSNTLSTIESDKGYWIYMNEAGSIDMAGWQPALSSITLSGGWNLVGYSGTTNEPVEAALDNVSNKWQIVWNWVSGKWYGKHRDVANLPLPIQPLSHLNQGKAYWIKAEPGQQQAWTQTIDYGNYFPTTIGSTWSINVKASETGKSDIAYRDTLQITGTKEINGIQTTVFHRSNPSNSGMPKDDYRLVDSTGVTYYGNNDSSDKVTPQMVPYPEARFLLQPGSSFEQLNMTSLDFGQDLDHDGINETFSMNSVVSVVGFETVSLPFLGSFPDSVRIETTLTLVVTLSSNDVTITETGVDRAWYAPGVGQVKAETSLAIGSYAKTINYELTGYSVDGAAKGILSQFVVASGVVTPDSDTQRPGPPAISSDGTNYLLLSCRELGSPTGIYGVLVSEKGDPLKSFQIAPLPTEAWVGCMGVRPSVAFDGTNYLVAYSRSGQIVATRVSPAGDVIDGPNGFSISSGIFPSVAFDGTNYLVVWAKFQNEYNIYGARVTKSGQVLGEFPISQASREQVEPSVAFDGNNYMVVWTDQRNEPMMEIDRDIYGARITKEGTVLDPVGIPISTAPGVQATPKIVFDGNNYFAVWVDERRTRSYFDNDVYGTRITPNGALLDGPSDVGGIPVNISTHNSSYVAAIFDGTNYFVVWTNPDYSDSPYFGVFAVRVSTGGSVIDGPASGTGISVSGLPPANATRYVYPTIFFNGKSSLLTWVKNSETPGDTKDIDAALIYPF